MENCSASCAQQYITSIVGTRQTCLLPVLQASSLRSTLQVHWCVRSSCPHWRYEGSCAGLWTQVICPMATELRPANSPPPRQVPRSGCCLSDTTSWTCRCVRVLCPVHRAAFIRGPEACTWFHEGVFFCRLFENSSYTWISTILGHPKEM